MKTNYFNQLVFTLFIASAGLTAQNINLESISISGTKFTYPLIEKWISEYNKVNPSIRFKLVQKATSGQTIDLNIIAHQPLQEELNPNQEIVFAGKYALLPVTNTKNPFFTSASKKGLSKKDIDKLFFNVVDYDAEPTKEKAKFASTIYARDNKACASTTLANFFGHTASEIRGKKVLGDDIYLLSAIKKDSIGLAYNNLGYLFDTNSRKLKDGIAVLPLDLKNNTKDLLNGNLDFVIDVLEKNQIETVPVEKIGFIYSQTNTNKEISAFLKWVLTDGQQFNHDKGFLNLDKQTLAEQIDNLNDKFLTSK